MRESAPCPAGGTSSGRTLFMVVNKGIEIRLYPTKSQEVFFNKTFGCVRFVYNTCLWLKSELYRETYMPFDPKLKSFKEEWPWLLEADSQGLANAYMDMRTAYRNFFEGKTKYPKYKKKTDKQSYRNCQPRKDIRKLAQGNFIYLPKIGKVMCRYGNKLAREDIRKVCSVTVSRSSRGKYYCSICCEVDVKPMPHTGEVGGCDLGIKTTVVTSDGEVYGNPHLLKKSERKVNHLQRKLAKARKGGSNYEKARRRLASAHEKLGNRRYNFQHQVSHDIVSKYDVICLENLNVKGMMQNHRLAVSLADVGLGTLSRMIAYKALWNDRTVVTVGRFFPSSQLCNCCGYRYRLLRLNERSWICPQCGAAVDRDLNAARNIRDEGLRIIDNTGTPRTGETAVIRPLSLAELPLVDERRFDLKSNGAYEAGNLLEMPGEFETHRSLAGG